MTHDELLASTKQNGEKSASHVIENSCEIPEPNSIVNYAVNAIHIQSI